VPRRTRWRGRGHESTSKEGRTAVRRSRAGWRNSGEKSRPPEGAIGSGRARASFNRGRDISGTNFGELN
jgi:hypothetical protein